MTKHLQRGERWYRRMMAANVLAVAGLILLTWSFALFEVSASRERLQQAARFEADALAEVFAEALTRQLSELDTALLLMRETLRTPRADGLDEFARTSRTLREGPLAGEVLQVSVIDADGYLVVSDLKRPSAPIYLRDRAHFQAHADSHDDRLYISEPLRGRVSGALSLQFTRRIPTTEGGFGGVLVLSIDPTTLAQRPGVLSLRPDARLWVRNAQGTVLSHYPEPLPGPDETAHLTRASLPLGNYPLAVEIGLDQGAREARATAQARAWLGAALALSLVAGLAGLFIHQGLRSRRQVEIALAWERKHLAEAQSAAGIGSWEWTPEGAVSAPPGNAASTLRWSDETRRLLDLPADAPASFETLLQRVHEDDRPRLQADLQRTWRAGDRLEREYRVRLPTAGERILYERGHAERDEDGQLRVLGMLLDVTERRRIQQALADKQARLTALIGAMAEGVVVLERDGSIALRNRAATELLGLDSSLTSANPLDPAGRALGEDGVPLPGTAHPALRARRGGQDIDGEVIGMCQPDGQVRWLSVNCRPLTDGEAPHPVLATFTDITRIKEAELDAQLADTLVEQTLQPIVVTDAAGRIRRCNPAYCRSVGLAPATLIGQRAGDANRSDRHDATFYQQMWQALTQRGRWEGEIWNRRPNGEVFLEWLAITALHAHGDSREVQGYVGIYTDITERKRREEAMWRAANHDTLTGLPNRLLLADRLRAGLARARRAGTRMAVLFLDLDHFKPINDTWGHAAGDAVLREIARRLRDCVREDDTVARNSGDEFVAVLHLGEQGDAGRVADAMLAAVTRPVPLPEGGNASLSCSIGIAVFPDDAPDAPDADGAALIALADAAMYRVKQHGRAGHARHGQDGVTHLPSPQG